MPPKRKRPATQERAAGRVLGSPPQLLESLENRRLPKGASSKRRTRTIAQLRSLRRALASRSEQLRLAVESMVSSERALAATKTALAGKIRTLNVAQGGFVHLLESSGIGTLHLDRDLRIRGFAPSATALFGISASDVGRPIAQLAARFGGEDLASDAQQVLDGLAPLERLVQSSDGSSWFIFRIKPQTTNDVLAGVVVTFVDVSGLKRTEAALARSRENLSLLAQASVEIMASLDAESMLRRISEAALEVTGARFAVCGHGYLDGQLVVGGSARVAGAPACPPGDMFREDRGGVHMLLVEGADVVRLTNAELRSHPRWWGLPEGHVPMRGLLGVRMLPGKGQPTGMILVTDKVDGEFTDEDVSLLKQLATVGSLALEQLRARVALEEADRRKDEFLAMLSHELRNPLAPIRNSVYVLERAPAGGEQARRAQAVIDRQVGHLTRLVDDLLDVTRITRGKVKLNPEPLDLVDLVRRSVEDHRPALTASGVSVELAIPEDEIWIEVDRTRIAQVIDNLLQNAARFTPAGGAVEVSVAANAELGHAIATVRDTGEGIPADLLPHVFEAFTQGEMKLDRPKGGLGLGLAIVKGLVEMHGGTVAVRSDGPGRGAEFTVRLPLAASIHPMERQGRTRRKPLASRRILVVEDNVDAAESLRELLRLGSHTVEVASSGPEGIEMARSFRPDVILCDIGLPGIDGYGVARALKADPALGASRLVALSGYATPEDITRAKEAGFDVHIAKPATREKLEEVLAPAPR